MEELVRQFVDDATELLNDMEQNLLNIEEKGFEEDSLHRIFRTLHTIKGNAGLVGLLNLKNACHRAEDYLDWLKRHRGESSGDSVDKMFSLMDILQNAISGLPDTDSPLLVEKISTVLGEGEKAADPVQADPVQADPVQAGTVPAGPETASGPAAAGGPSGGDAAGCPEGAAGLREIRDLLHEYRALAALRETLRTPEEDLTEFGMQCIVFNDAVPQALEGIKRLAGYLEELMTLILRSDLAYDEDSFSLADRILSDIAAEIEQTLQRHPGIGVTYLRNPGDMSEARLPQTNCRLLALYLQLSYEETLGDPDFFQTLYRIHKERGLPVVFIQPRGDAIAKIGAFIRDALGYPFGIYSSLSEAVTDLGDKGDLN